MTATARVVDLVAVVEARAALARIALERPYLLSAGPVDAAAWRVILEGDELERMTYTVREAADVLGVHPETVRRAIRSRELPAAKLTRDYRISRAELATWWRDRGGGDLYRAETDGRGGDK